MTKTNRNYGIDLLRIVSMFMICMLHSLGQGGILNNCSSNEERIVFDFLEVLSFGAVDIFGIISGYVYTTRKDNYKNIIYFWLQTFFYSFVITVVLTLFRVGQPLNAIDWIRCLLPIQGNIFWYMTAYIPLLFFMPFIGKTIDGLEEENAKKLAVILIAIIPLLTVVNGFWLNDGYSFAWILILFMIGMVAKKVSLFNGLNKKIIIACYFICHIVTTLCYYLFNVDYLVSYTSPTVLLPALLLISVFSKININDKYVSIIKKISPLTLGIYLFQCNLIIWNFVLEDAIASYMNANLVIELFVSIVLAFVLFFVGLIVDYIRMLLFKLININDLCDLLANKFSIIVDKIVLCFKEDN